MVRKAAMDEVRGEIIDRQGRVGEAMHLARFRKHTYDTWTDAWIGTAQVRVETRRKTRSTTPAGRGRRGRHESQSSTRRVINQISRLDASTDVDHNHIDMLPAQSSRLLSNKRHNSQDTLSYLEATAALVATGARARDIEQATIVNICYRENVMERIRANGRTNGARERDSRRDNVGDEMAPIKGLG